MAKRDADQVRTLDVAELQVIVEFPEDEDGFYWHHRLALQRLSAGRWVMLTPDMELEVVDLTSQSYKLLLRGGRFPAPQAPYVYAFVPISDTEIAKMKRHTKGFVELLGEGDVGEASALVWAVCDPRGALFGKIVPTDVVEDDGSFACVGSRGVAQFEGAPRFCEQVDRAHLNTAIRDWKPDGGDCRILAITRDPSGRRCRTLRDALASFLKQRWNIGLTPGRGRSWSTRGLSGTPSTVSSSTMPNGFG